MARVSRTTNPTNLIEIDRTDVGLSRLDISGRPHFKVDRLDLTRYTFAGDEIVTVIARAGPTSKRYELGTVTTWARDVLDLSTLDLTQVLKFRLLIRRKDSAKLLAAAENLRCRGDGDIESLLPIVSTDLGQRLWRILIDADGAILQCNEKVFPSGASAESYAPFRALVLPEALRQVLEYIANDPEMLNGEGTIWAEWGAWMGQLGIEYPPIEESELLAEWLLESTAQFCEEFKCADDLQRALQQDDAS
jgi:hypothetical protein